MESRPVESRVFDPHASRCQRLESSNLRRTPSPRFAIRAEPVRCQQFTQGSKFSSCSVDVLIGGSWSTPRHSTGSVSRIRMPMVVPNATIQSRIWIRGWRRNENLRDGRVDPGPPIDDRPPTGVATGGLFESVLCTGGNSYSVRGGSRSGWSVG